MRLINILVLYSIFIFSDNSSLSGVSFQGYTGLINIPNAQVIEEGSAVLHFNNQFDNNLRYYDYSKDMKDSEENYIFGVGFLPSLEIVGRVVEAEGYARDLSANVKYKIPLHYRYLPNIAIGIQDIGGSFNFFDNKYIVADKKIGFLRAIIGYGKSGDVVKDKRMDGVFGGVELELASWLNVVVEDDTKEKHAGVKLSIPKELVSSFNVEATLARNLTSNSNSFGFNLILPLKKRDNKEAIKQRIFNLKNNITYKKNKQISNLFELKEFLYDFGFEDVRVGIYQKDVVYIECENSIFDHNDLDAIGFIIGTVANSNLNYKYYTVTLLKNRIQTISVNGTILSFKKYIKNPSKENLYKVQSTLLIKKEFDTSKVEFIGDRENSSLFKPRFEFSPGLITTVGSSVGVFDYLISLRSKLYFPLYNGLVFTAMYEMPFAHSNNFDDGNVLNLMYGNKCDSRLVNANINQAFHYGEFFNILSGGIFNTDYYGIFNQSNFNLLNGKHALNVKLGTYWHKDIKDITYNVYEGGYRYYYDSLELFATIKYGKYWNDDKGLSFELKRFFGDVAVLLEYQKLENQYVGAKIMVPLTPRKIAKAYPIGQIKGKNDFSHGIKSTVRLDDGTNRIILSEGFIPKVGLDLNSYYLNRDRLNSTYIVNHIDRLREAYLIYSSIE